MENHIKIRPYGFSLEFIVLYTYSFRNYLPFYILLNNLRTTKRICIEYVFFVKININFKFQQYSLTTLEIKSYEQPCSNMKNKRYEYLRVKVSKLNPELHQPISSATN